MFVTRGDLGYCLSRSGTLGSRFSYLLLSLCISGLACDGDTFEIPWRLDRLVVSQQEGTHNEACLVYGGSTRLPSFPLNDLTQQLRLNSTRQGSRDNFCSTIATADLNDDWTRDIVVGVRGRSDPGVGGRPGGLHVFIMADYSGVETDAEVRLMRRSVGGLPGLLGGHGLALRYNDEGPYPDLVAGSIGYPLEQQTPINGSGAVFVFSNVGPNSEIRLFRAGVAIDQEPLGTNWPDDRFGWDITSSDIDQNGQGDLIVTAASDRVGDSQEGSVYVLMEREGDFRPEQIIRHPSSSRSTDYFGHSLLTADFNGDEIPDLAISSPGEVGGRGGVLIYHGRHASDSKHWFDFSHRVLPPPQRDSRGFGFKIILADLNGDKKADLIVSAPGNEATLLRYASPPFETTPASYSGYVAIYYASDDSDFEPTPAQILEQRKESLNRFFGVSSVAGNFFQLPGLDLAVGGRAINRAEDRDSVMLFNNRWQSDEWHLEPHQSILAENPNTIFGVALGVIDGPSAGLWSLPFDWRQIRPYLNVGDR